MEQNFNLLLERVLDTLEKSDLLAIKQQLENIKGNTILVGAGGSSVVSTFASKVLNIPNIRSARDLNYMDLKDVDNIIVFSYSGKGYVVESLLDKNKKIYLFTNGDKTYENVETIKYDSTIKNEYSFISLASTLMPMAILYHYYHPLRLPHFESNITDMFDKAKDINIHHNKVYEILTGYDSLAASKYLETTMVESGIATPIIHDKYDYCHGRSTISYHSNNGLILFDSGKELDDLLFHDLKEYYTEIVKIDRYYPNDCVIDNDFYATICSMYLTKKLAENKEMDLSKVDYSPMVEKLYKYKGEM